MIKLFAPWLAVLAVACSPGGDGNTTAEKRQPQAPSKPVATVASALPDAFVGRWGIGPNDCDPKRDDTKGLMVVEPTLLRFYEMRAKVGEVVVETPDHVVAHLSWSGEGMTWETKTPLTLDPNGKALVRLDHETGREIQYDRCPDPSSETKK